MIPIDARLDSRDEYMRIKNNHACITRRASEHLGIENAFVLGCRSISQEELKVDEVVPHIDAYQIHVKGIKWAMKKLLDSVKNEKVHVTLDIDGIDPASAASTSDTRRNKSVISYLSDIYGVNIYYV